LSPLAFGDILDVGVERVAGCGLPGKHFSPIRELGDLVGSWLSLVLAAYPEASGTAANRGADKHPGLLVNGQSELVRFAMDDVRLPFLIMSFVEDPRLTDAFRAVQEAVQSVLRIPDERVPRIRIDYDIREHPDRDSGYPCVSEAVLDAIRDSLFIVCDTTHNRPNCYFELGYALAYGKRIFHIHRKDSDPPHFDVSCRPIIFYTGAEQLREKLTSTISAHFGPSVRPAQLEIPDFFERCGLPLRQLEGDARYNYRIGRGGERPIALDFVTQEPYSAPEGWSAAFNDVLATELRLAHQQGSVIFNGRLVRVKDYVPSRVEATGERSLRLEAQHTDYYTFVSSNHGLEYLSVAQREELHEREKKAMEDLRSSVLGNPLTVSLCVILTDRDREWVLVQERNTKKVFHCKRRFQCSAAGMVSADRDRRAHGVDVYAAAQNELEEELGITVREHDITFLGLLRETTNYEVGLVAEVCVQADPKELVSGLKVDPYEVVRVTRCPFTPEDYAAFVQKNGGVDNFVPLGIGATVYSLLKRFPAERVVSSMSRLAG
jgi:8-oxo-dGTP pyrophosphatase MutT (NUDIX family)